MDKRRRENAVRVEKRAEMRELLLQLSDDFPLHVAEFRQTGEYGPPCVRGVASFGASPEVRKEVAMGNRSSPQRGQ